MPLIGRRRPLLRAAAVGGGAYMAGKSRANSQQREYDEQARIEALEEQQAQQQAAPVQYAAPPAAAPASSGIGDDAIAKIKELAQLHEQGILTDDEFAAQKAKLLGT